MKEKTNRISFEEKTWDKLKEADNKTDDRTNAMLPNTGVSSYLELSSGEQFDFFAFRNKETTGEGAVQPEYKMQILSGDSVKILPQDRYVQGGPEIEGVKSGVSIIKVTYDPCAVETFSNNSPTVFEGSGSESAAIIVVNVDGADSSGIDTGITTDELDAIYYMNSISDGTNTIKMEKDYAEYSFTPKASDGIDSVQVHSTIGNWSEQDWKDCTANVDGSYTAKLYNGKNIIKVTSKNAVKYHVIQAYGLDAHIKNGTVVQNDNGIEVIVSPGDKMELHYDGMVMTLPKLDGIYNPGIRNVPGQGWNLENAEFIQYELDDKVVEGVHTQYNLPESNKFIWTAPTQEGQYIFQNGKVSTTGFGAPLDNHRKIRKGSRENMFHLEMLAPVFFREYSSLPAINVVVTEEKAQGALTVYSVKKPENLPEGAKISVINAKGRKMSTIAGKWYLSSGIYTYAVSCKGYLTAYDTFTVEEPAVGAVSEKELDLSQISLQKAPEQSGTVSVEINGSYSSLINGSAEISVAKMPDLMKKRYVSYNYGGYTLLHALVEVLNKNNLEFTCQNGVLYVTDKGKDGTAETEQTGLYICEKNDTFVKDYANTLASDGDKIVFYHVAGENAFKAMFKDTTAAVSSDQSVTLNLSSKPVTENVAYAACADASMQIDEKETGYKTDTSGEVILPGSIFAGEAGTDSYAIGGAGWHEVIPFKKDDSGQNTLSYTAAKVYVRWKMTDTVQEQGRADEETTCYLKELAEKIHTIKTVDALTLSDEKDVTEVFKLAEALTDSEYSRFLAMKESDTLDSIYQKWDSLKRENVVSGVKAEITAIYRKKTFEDNEETRETLKKARQDYEQLRNSEKKQMITWENWLINAENVLQMLQNMNVNIATAVYDGKPQKPDVTITYQGKKLTAQKDYTVSYSDNIQVGTGTATITIYGKSGYQGVKQYSFLIENKKVVSKASNTEPVLKKESSFTVGNLTYQVTQSYSGSACVTVIGTTNKKSKVLTIPATLRYKNVAVTVTAIEKNAFKNCKKLKKVTVGANINSIGKNAFAGDKNLKTITVQTKNLKKVGAGAFKGIHSKAVIKVPKGKRKEYQKLFKGKGQKKSVKIK